MPRNVEAVKVESSKLSIISRASQLKYRIKAEANHDSFSPFLKILRSQLSKTFYVLEIS